MTIPAGAGAVTAGGASTGGEDATGGGASFAFQLFITCSAGLYVGV